MKQIFVTLLALLALSVMWVFSPIHLHASSLLDAKNQLQNTRWGAALIQRVDSVVEQIAQVAENDDQYRRKVTQKISTIRENYAGKTDEKSKTITKVFAYLDAKLTARLWITSSRLIERLKKVEVDKYKNRANSRVQNVKEKNYQRIHLKK